MLIGPLWGSVVARLAIHSWSSHWWNWSVTTEAVAGGDLGGAGHRVGLLVPGSVGEAELELVARTDPHARNEQLPHSR